MKSSYIALPTQPPISISASLTISFPYALNTATAANSAPQIPPATTNTEGAR